MPRLLFFVSEDWYFCSHRLPVARAARDAGFEVVVACHCTGHGKAIEAEGFRLIPLPLDRTGRNPLREMLFIARLIGIYRRERPDIVHHVAMKPVLYGSLAAWLTGVPAVVNALAGLGFLFTNPKGAIKLASTLVLAAFRFLLDRPNARLIVQNRDDQAMFRDRAIVSADRIALIRGSGVDIAAYTPQPECPGPVVAALVARMLWDKGVGEAVEAARLLKCRGVDVRVVLVGDPDPANPRSIDQRQLDAWAAEGVVEWWGHRADIAAVYAAAHIALLPSYREGLPKSLLEACACGRPAVTTDVPGCRELIEDGVNGLLVPARDPAALAAALEQLAQNPQLRHALGGRGRALVERDFSDGAVGAETIALYHSLLSRRQAGSNIPG